MKPAVLLFSTGILAASGIAQSGGAAQSEPFSISIAPLAKQVSAGKDIALRMTVTNNSQQDIVAGSGFRAQGLDTSFKYDCRDGSGNSVAKEISLVGSVHDAPILKPGRSRTEIVPLSRACTLNQPGPYSIQVSRTDPRDVQHRLIKSNTIVITVSP
ncbi:MAG: hypothetical protein JO356_05970 [Acidobacteria bacterium]|nr:hypothetical protein [Acidobacteriota bacterium]